MQSGKQSWLHEAGGLDTGAIRLEDLKGQFLVIQIANKSMLIDSKSGQRVLDDCMNAAQKACDRQAEDGRGRQVSRRSSPAAKARFERAFFLRAAPERRTLTDRRQSTLRCFPQVLYKT